MGEIRKAAERLDARKAAAVGPDLMGTATLSDEGPAILMLSGLDLDLEEVGEFCARTRQIMLAAAVQGVPITDLAAALWVEGLAMGLLIAESRGGGGIDDLPG